MPTPPSAVNTLRTVSGVLEPVGVVEIAQRLGVTRDAIDKWRARGLGFPDPRWTVGGRPAWQWDEIEDWARRTGRLPDEGQG